MREATRPHLVVPVEARDHEHLLEQLGRLRQGVPVAGAQAGGHKVVAGTCGSNPRGVLGAAAAAAAAGKGGRSMGGAVGGSAERSSPCGGLVSRHGPCCSTRAHKVHGDQDAVGSTSVHANQPCQPYPPSDRNRCTADGRAAAAAQPRTCLPESTVSGSASRSR